MATQDIEEIRNLMYAYCWRIDAGDFDGVCELMKDADVSSGGRLVVSRNVKRFRKFFLSGIRLYEDGTPKTTHMCVNPIIELSEDGLSAKGKSYTVVLQGITGEFPPRVIWIDRKYDTFVKEDGRWKFRTRNYVTRSEGDVSAHLKSYTTIR